MQQNAPFCILLKKHFFGGGANPPDPPPTAFSLSRVGMYAARVLNINFKSERAGTPNISITEIRYNKI